MIAFTKEQLIASAHARIEFAEMMLAGELEPLKERTWSIELELARIALASLEAEAVAYTEKCEITNMQATGLYLRGFPDNSQGRDIALYTATPVPASVPDRSMFEKWWESEHGSPLDSWDSLRTTDGYCDDGIDGQFEAWNACRAAMLQGAEPVTTAYKFPFEQWLSQQGERIEIDCGCVSAEVFMHWLRMAYGAGNSPVIPGGYVLVPVEPTTAILDEFDSIIDYGAEDSKDAWSRLIAAAPQQEAK